MKNWIANKSFIVILSGLLLAVLTFPFFDMSIDAGIDPPLKWVFSHIASNDFSLGQHINFPHGPLAFFMYPTHETLLITVILMIGLKISLVYLFSRLFSELCFLRWVHILISAYLIFITADINQLIIANLITAYLVAYKTQRVNFKLYGFLLTALALYIKSYVAIITGMITVSFVLFEFYKNRSILKTISDGLILLGLFASFWLFLYGGLKGFVTYFIGILQLAQDNSSAAAYYPFNNWIALSVFLFIVFVLPFVQKSDRSLFFGIIVLPSIFGAWKHGMAREDISHISGLFNYVFILYVLFFLFEKKHRIINFIAVSVALYAFNWNVPNAYNYNPASNKKEWSGLHHFQQIITGKTPIAHHSLKKLPTEVRRQIGNRTVDIYPWDYSIAATNELNWTPRPVIHSYAAYTHWLDKRNADHFHSNDKPEFIIWEVDNISTDINGGRLTSIDQRYLLNDEPQTLLAILSNYDVHFRNKDFIILKRTKQKTPIHACITKSENRKMDRWIDVPNHEDVIMRLKVNHERSAAQKLKSFVYKDEQYWIELKLESGEIHKYRFVPKNAADGLWIGPYFTLTNRQVEKVVQIRISASNKKWLDQSIHLNWEHISFDGDKLNAFFGPMNPKKPTFVFRSRAEFTDNHPNWKCDKTERTEENGNAVLKSKSPYPCSFVYPLSDQQQGKYECHIQFRYKGDWLESKDVQIVASIEDAQHPFWETKFFYPQLIHSGAWNSVVETFEMIVNESNKELKVYLSNPTGAEIHLSNIEVFLRKVD